MDLNDLWQNHKRFILGICAALIVLLIGLAIIGSTWSSDEYTSGISKRRADLMKIAVPKKSDLAEVQADTDRNAAALEALTARLRFQPADLYVLAKNVKSPDLAYNEVRSTATETLVKTAARQNIRVDETLGLPPFTPAGREAIQRNLWGLNVVAEVLTAAILAEVRAVDSIEVIDDKGSRRRDADRFIQPLAVKFRVSGSTGSIADLVSRLARSKAPYIAISDALIVPDAKRAIGLTTLDMTVHALLIESESKDEGGR